MTAPLSFISFAPVLAKFEIWDWGVVGAYFALITCVGLALSRRDPDDKEYFLGGRSMPTWTVAVSIVATMLSAATFVGVPSQVYQGDLTYLILNIGGFIAVFVVAFLFVPKLYRAGTVTIYGFLAQRFGEPSRVAASCAFIVGRMLASGARLFVAAIPLCLLLFETTKPTTGQLITAICIIAVVGTFYTTLGGVRAVVWVDAIQLFIVIGTAFVTIGLLFHRIPLSIHGIYDALAHTINPKTGASKLLVLDLSTDISRPNTLWTALTGAVFLNVATFGVDHDLAQRFLITKSVRKGGLSVIASQFLGVAVVALFMCIGLLLFLFYNRPDIMGAAMPRDLPEKPDGVYPWFLLHELPTVLSGISIAGFFAIAQGSLDSAMNALASSIVADIYLPLKRRMGHPAPQHHAGESRLAVVAVGAMLCGFAVVCALIYNPEKNTLLTFALGVLTFAWTGMLGVFLTALCTNRGNNASVIAALIVGAVVVTLFQDPVISLWSKWFFKHGLVVAFPWWMTLGTVLSFLVCAAGSPRPVPQAARGFPVTEDEGIE